MKAVVTGGAGFIGSHLTAALIAGGAEVHVVDNLTTGQRSKTHPEAALHVTDIESPELPAVFASIKPDVVFHLAAQADVQQSIRDPRYDTQVNVLGTLNVLQASRDAGVRKFIFASTSGVYGDLQKERIREDDPEAPISFYGLSKFAAEQYIRLFYDMYGLSYTILRYGNVYGPGQLAKGEGGVVAVFLDRLKAQEALHIHGDGEQTRDFVYVRDVAAANLAAVHDGDQRTIHVSTGVPTTVNALAEQLVQLHSNPLPIVHTPARAGDIRHSCLDNAQSRCLLGWQPRYTVAQGLAETYAAFLGGDGSGAST